MFYCVYIEKRIVRVYGVKAFSISILFQHAHTCDYEGREEFPHPHYRRTPTLSVCPSSPFALFFLS